jgi:hypothetical protein
MIPGKHSAMPHAHSPSFAYFAVGLCELGPEAARKQFKLPPLTGPTRRRDTNTFTRLPKVLYSLTRPGQLRTTKPPRLTRPPATHFPGESNLAANLQFQYSSRTTKSSHGHRPAQPALLSTLPSS